MFDLVGEQARVEHIGGLPLLALSHANPRGWQFTLKHIGDRVTAAIGLVVISPLFLTLMVLVRLSSPGPIFFGQPRIGRDGRDFQCRKFRSMRAPRESDTDFELNTGSAPGGIEGDDRRTGVGKIMRATSMDELPQLINVIKGEMSLVGPRPLPLYEVNNFQKSAHRRRLSMKPGLTCLWQIRGRNDVTNFDDWVRMDLEYIDNWSLGMDLRILIGTIPVVLLGAGAR